MEKGVKVKFISVIDDVRMEYFYDGILIEGNPKRLKYIEHMDNHEIDTSIVLGKEVIITRSNGIEMFQEFIVGQTTIMDYRVDSVTMQFRTTTHDIINDEGYLKVTYSSDSEMNSQKQQIEIYYS